MHKKHFSLNNRFFPIYNNLVLPSSMYGKGASVPIRKQLKPNAKNDGLWENANDGAFQRMTMINDRPDDIYVAANVVAGGSTT